MENFSSRKKANNPIRSVRKRCSGFACISNASGSACSREVESIMPTDRLIINSIIRARTENDNAAASVTLVAPIQNTASSVKISGELMFLLLFSV